ncbi:MAG TPA: uL30 family ribosomal protein [Candidatus Bilamarchaeaceae archaeon]|nr:uL30 family ribosomal protein [Candidatus Bilamarchaeaceae archaeon]
MKLAIVRIRGKRNMKPKIKHTLKLMRLHRPNHCIVVEDTPVVLGMLGIVDDYVTFGPVEEKTMESLQAKRGNEKGETKVYRLHPPRKGHKSIKHRYPRGALGKRPEMDSLLRRMM